MSVGGEAVSERGTDTEARQSLPACSARSGRVGSTNQAKKLASSRAQVVARGGQEAAASQRPRHRARQQAMVVAGSSLDRHTTAKEAGLPKFKVSAWVAYVLRVQSTNRSINMSRLYSRGAQCYLPVQCQTHQNQ
jgi:hypothetical protein